MASKKEQAFTKDRYVNTNFKGSKLFSVASAGRNYQLIESMREKARRDAARQKYWDEMEEQNGPW